VSNIINILTIVNDDHTWRLYKHLTLLDPIVNYVENEELFFALLLTLSTKSSFILWQNSVWARVLKNRKNILHEKKYNIAPFLPIVNTIFHQNIPRYLIGIITHFFNEVELILLLLFVKWRISAIGCALLARHCPFTNTLAYTVAFNIIWYLNTEKLSR
jgi:hypothetical protein